MRTHVIDVLGRLSVALAGRYSLQRELGRGGMATVYLAQDLRHAKLLPVLVEIRVASGEIAAAAEGASELEAITTTYTSPALVASAARARGRVMLARGQDEQAMLHLQRAGRIWAELDLPIELAQTRLLLSRAYSAPGNTDEAELEGRTARAAMDRVAFGRCRVTK